MSNLSLENLQTALQKYLLNEESNIDLFTTETPDFSRDERLGIYHTAYRLRLIDALRNDFPALEIFIGHDVFVELMNEFVEAHPSKHPSLRWLGTGLENFLRGRSDIKDLVEIHELAAFEWAQAMAFDAPDAECKPMNDVCSLQNYQWLNLRLQFHPSLQQLRLFSNAPDLWHALVKDETKIETVTNIEPGNWLVWRNELQVLYRSIDETEHWSLNKFLNDKNFSDACEGLCEWLPPDQVPLKAAQYLQRWLQNGLVTNIITDES